MNFEDSEYSTLGDAVEATVAAIPLEDYVVDDDDEEVELVLPPVPLSSAQPRQDVPELVRVFVIYLHGAIQRGSTSEIQDLYLRNFNNLSTKMADTKGPLAGATWPPAAAISPLVKDDPVFLMLYKDLYYRHVFSKIQPTLEDRVDIFFNYCAFFNHVLSSDKPVQLELPNQWLWDIIDEFVYQFQNFCLYRAKLKVKSSDEVRYLRQHTEVWNVHNVLNVLHSFVQKSNIKEQLKAAKDGRDPAEVAGEYGVKPLYKMLGLFSLVNLLRLQCHLGDFYLALREIDGLELNRKALFTRVLACHVTTYYYISFAYIMMRRYHDALKILSSVLNFLLRSKQTPNNRTYQSHEIGKKTDQMFALLAIVCTLCPQQLDSNVYTNLRDKQGEKLLKMMKGDDEALAVFEELFKYAAPKLISPSFPDGDAPIVDERRKHISAMFLQDIKEQLQIPSITSYLKLFSSLHVSKLASFLDVESDELRTLLTCFKHKIRSKIWNSGSLSSGTFGYPSSLDFSLNENDVIAIREMRASHSSATYFLNNTHKLEELLAVMESKLE